MLVIFSYCFILLCWAYFLQSVTSCSNQKALTELWQRSDIVIDKEYIKKGLSKNEQI